MKSVEILSDNEEQKPANEEKQREDEQAMFELIDHISRLLPEEKLEFALKVSRLNPSFVRSLRDELRMTIELKDRALIAPCKNSVVFVDYSF